MKKLGKIQTLAIAAITALAFAAPIVMAQSGKTDQQGEKQGWSKGERGERRGGKHGEGRGGRHGDGMMFRGLNLTDDQKTRMQQIRQSFGERTQSLREQLHAKRQELRDVEEGGTFNEALATQKLTESASLEAKLMGERFRLRQEMLSVLTPEQKTQMEQQRAAFKAKRAERRGMQQQ